MSANVTIDDLLGKVVMTSSIEKISELDDSEDENEDGLAAAENKHHRGSSGTNNHAMVGDDLKSSHRRGLSASSQAQQQQQQQRRFVFQPQPFTVAFEEGHWLLLDELNLAPDVVLQCIERALDSGELIVHDTTNATDSVRRIVRHRDFQLFATQNPNSGFFRGKREKLSGSILSRFRCVVFNKLSDIEWLSIVEKKLIAASINQMPARSLAEKGLRLHNEIYEKVHGKDVGGSASNDSQSSSSTSSSSSSSTNRKLDIEFSERESYSEITIRELLKYTKLVASIEQNTTASKNDLLASAEFMQWCIYGARYRKQGRFEVGRIINKYAQINQDLKKLWSPKLFVSSSAELNQECKDLIEPTDPHTDLHACRFGVYYLKIEPKLYEKSLVVAQIRQAAGYTLKFPALTMNSNFTMFENWHAEICEHLTRFDTIFNYGLYQISPVWFTRFYHSWMRAIMNHSDSNQNHRIMEPQLNDHAVQVGIKIFVECYLYQIRNLTLRSKIVQTIDVTTKWFFGRSMCPIFSYRSNYFNHCRS